DFDMDGTEIPQPQDGAPDRGAYEYVFPQDKTPPEINKLEPPNMIRGVPGGTIDVPVRITTNEEADCQYSLSENADFGSGTPLEASEDRLTHTATFEDLSEGNHAYYVRASDDADNISADFVITFT